MSEQDIKMIRQEMQTEATTKTIRDLQAEAVFLSGLIGGADVLTDKATGLADGDIERKMASNSLPAVFEDLRRRADALAEGLEKLEKIND